MKKGKNNRIDITIDVISASERPINTTLVIENKYGTEFLNGILLRAIELGDMKAANTVYKTMILKKLYRVNLFISAYQTGTCEDYLNSLSVRDKDELVDAILVKLNMGAGTEIDYEVLGVLKDYLTSRTPILGQ